MSFLDYFSSDKFWCHGSKEAWCLRVISGRGLLVSVGERVERKERFTRGRFFKVLVFLPDYFAFNRFWRKGIKETP